MSRLVVTVLMASSHNSGPFSSRPTPGAASLGPECADAAGGGGAPAWDLARAPVCPGVHS